MPGSLTYSSDNIQGSTNVYPLSFEKISTWFDAKEFGRLGADVKDMSPGVYICMYIYVSPGSCFPWGSDSSGGSWDKSRPTLSTHITTRRAARSRENVNVVDSLFRAAFASIGWTSNSYKRCLILPADAGGNALPIDEQGILSRFLLCIRHLLTSYHSIQNVQYFRIYFQHLQKKCYTFF